MRLLAILAIAAGASGAAYAEQFDLVCATTLTVEMPGRPSSTTEQEMRYSLDTDEKSIRRHGPDNTPLPLTISAERYVFQIGAQEWAIDRQTSKIATATTQATYAMSLTGDCTRQAFTTQ